MRAGAAEEAQGEDECRHAPRSEDQGTSALLFTLLSTADAKSMTPRVALLVGEKKKRDEKE